jgi:uncharacterized protein YbdZ (MbtH family)
MAPAAGAAKGRSKIMDADEIDDKTVYRVVVNHEEQYSIWPLDRALPRGWNAEGKEGTKGECLDHIEKVWTDMRPLSVRRQIDEWKRATATAPAAAPEPADVGDDLVTRLSRGDHPVEVSLRPERTLAALRECIDRNYVHVKFTDTAGGTELGLRLDHAASDLARGDFANGAGAIRLVGDLTLDFIRVRCHAQIDLGSLSGRGRLERAAEA